MKANAEKLLVHKKVYQLSAFLGAGVTLACLAVTFAPMVFTVKVILFASAGVALLITGLACVILLVQKRGHSQELDRLAKMQAEGEEILKLEKAIIKELSDQVLNENYDFWCGTYENTIAYYRSNEQLLQREIVKSIYYGRLNILRVLLQAATPEVLNKPYDVKIGYHSYRGNTILEEFSVTYSKEGIEATMLKELLEAGMDPNRKRSNGEDIKEFLAKYQKTELITILESHKG